MLLIRDRVINSGATLLLYRGECKEDFEEYQEEDKVFAEEADRS